MGEENLQPGINDCFRAYFERWHGENKPSQRDMAQILDLSQSLFSRIRRGEASFTADKMERFAKHVGLDVVEILRQGQAIITGQPQEEPQAAEALKNALANLARSRAEAAAMRDVIARLEARVRELEADKGDMRDLLNRYRAAGEKAATFMKGTAARGSITKSDVANLAHNVGPLSEVLATDPGLAAGKE